MQFVLLGDGTTKIPIVGIGTIEITVKGNKLRLHDVLYCPTLNVSLFSTKLHMKYVGCYELSKENICTLAFPTFTFDAINDNEIHFTAMDENTPYTTPPAFDDKTATIFTTHKPNITFSTPTKGTVDTVSIVSIHKTKPVKNSPQRTSPGAIGYDLHSSVTTSIPPNSQKLVPLGFSMIIPSGRYARIAPHSGLALHNNIDVAAGVIDPDYRGEVQVLLVNSSQLKLNIKEGDQIAQMIFELAATPEICLLSYLPASKQQSNGFGSTGLSKSDTTNHPKCPPPIFAHRKSPNPPITTLPFSTNNEDDTTSPTKSSTPTKPNKSFQHHLNFHPPPV